jgi:elongator complex protein 3
MFNYNPYKVVENRLQQYEQINKPASKIELIFQGGTFPAESFSHQKYFVKRCFDAVIGKTSKSFSQAKRLAESSKKRIVGITFETRPDECSKLQINRMLSLGGTRVELGVQIPSDFVYKKIVRGHSVKDVVGATQRLKDSGFKVCYHLMPGLPGSSFDHDLEKLSEVFSNPDFSPDMVKIYPCLVIDKTPLHSLWKSGKFSPMNTEQASELISELKRVIPKWVRIMRIQRDIPADVIAAGVKHSNLRQFVEKKLKQKGIECNCIRCREAGLKQYKLNKQIDFNKVSLVREDYDASKGREIFLSFVDFSLNALIGFIRLRIPFDSFRKEIDSNTALIRELHVFGESVGVGSSPNSFDVQHKGFGKKLLVEAERIALEEFGKKKLVVISGIGVREYYFAQGYSRDGAFVSKLLA